MRNQYLMKNNLIVLRLRVVDVSFIVTSAHQKMKALLCRITFVKTCFVFLSIFFR